MFSKDVYIKRRKELTAGIDKGIVLILGNSDSPINTEHNNFRFRQDSTFLYYFGLNFKDLAGVIDLDSGDEYIFGNDVDIDDIVWMGPQTSVAEKSKEVGIYKTASLKELSSFLEEAIKKDRKIHFLPSYRWKTSILLEELLGIHSKQINRYVSHELIRAVVEQRSVKDALEIAEIENFMDITYNMFVTAMKLAKPGVVEQEIAGVMEGLAYKNGAGLSFPIVCSVHGEILHNPHYDNVLKKGDLLLIDAGAESHEYYATDITRTIPVGAKFTAKQKEIYDLVLKANMQAISTARPGIPYRDVHIDIAKTIAQGLKDLDLMKGDVNEAVNSGAHALFFPHGLGHMMGLDCHDMESLGEDNVGYDDYFKRSDQFGLAYLRMARKLQPGFIVSDEPGIYFIPTLINKWKKENKFSQFINYPKLEKYMDFGGIRIEDDLLITDNGCRVLGKPVPKTSEEIYIVTGW